jgi:transposase
VDHQSRSRVRGKKNARDRLIRLVNTHADWALGFQDETWWSRVAFARLHAGCDEGDPQHRVEKVKRKDDPDPKALACYGMLLRWMGTDAPAHEEVWLRFVNGSPVSAITTQFLEWCCAKLEAEGKRVLAMVWDNAPWHTSKAVRRWVRQHNRQVKNAGQGVRILVCYLPVKSPWLNPIEPKWLHANRRVVEPNTTLSAHELANRICDTFGCAHEDHLTIPEEVP